MYKNIKRHNRQEMEIFLRNLYNQGYELGFKEGAEVGEVTDIKIELVKFLDKMEVKGIGEKTKEKIIQAYIEMGRKDEL